MALVGKIIGGCRGGLELGRVGRVVVGEGHSRGRVGRVEEGDFRGVGAVIARQKCRWDTFGVQVLEWRVLGEAGRVGDHGPRTLEIFDAVGNIRIARVMSQFPLEPVPALGASFLPRNIFPQITIFNQIKVRVRETGESGRSQGMVDGDILGNRRIDQHKHVVTQRGGGDPGHRPGLALGADQFGGITGIGHKNLTKSIGFIGPINTFINRHEHQNTIRFIILSDDQTRPGTGTRLHTRVIIQEEAGLTLSAP